MGIIDFERGVKLSGSRFYLLKGAGARLQRALTDWFLDVHVTSTATRRSTRPLWCARDCMVGTGNLPKFGENLYRDAEEDFWFIPTAEVPVTNIYRDEIIEPGQAADLLCGVHALFPARESVGGQGCARHQARPPVPEGGDGQVCRAADTAATELESLTRDAEVLCERLGLPYRRLMIATGDLSFVACIKYDIEVWAAGSGEWLEASSCSYFRDFQARRANMRYRPAEGEKPEYVHTLNGSGLALPRIVIAILENNQQADGSIVVPEVLRAYMGGMEVIR